MLNKLINVVKKQLLLFIFFSRFVVMKPLAFVISPGLGRTAVLMILSGILVARRMKDPRVCVISVLMFFQVFMTFFMNTW